MHKFPAWLMQISVRNINKYGKRHLCSPTFTNFSFCCSFWGVARKGFDIRIWIIGYSDYYVITIHHSNEISSHLNQSSLGPFSSWFYSILLHSVEVGFEKPLTFITLIQHSTFNFKMKRELIQNFNYFKVRVAKSFSSWKTQQIVLRVQMSLLFFGNKRKWERKTKRSYLVNHLFSFH